MDKFETMRLFTRIVERRSFTLAAQDLELPRSTATEAMKGLEARLGVRLLHRTTRQVAPTCSHNQFRTKLSSDIHPEESMAEPILLQKWPAEKSANSLP